MAAFVGLSGCPGAADDVAPGADVGEYDGLSRDQIELQAESMTPAEAESLGIVDTTIRIEPPMNPDSVMPSSVAPAVGDTVN